MIRIDRLNRNLTSSNRLAARSRTPQRVPGWYLLGLLLLLGGASPLAAMKIPAPKIDARSYVLVEHESGQILAESDADAQVEPASITKVMTVYLVGKALAEGLITLEDEVVVSEKAWKMEGSRMFIEVGTRVTVDALLDGVIVQSGNDASVALAEHVSGTEDVFAGLMNQEAVRLGMTNSSFANATGLPDEATYSTARDLARLAAALIRDYPDLYERFAKREFTYNDIKQPNRNRLLDWDPTTDGIKTGHTSSAGYCLLSSANRDGMRLIAAVMGAASDTARTEASQALLNYGYRFFEARQIYAAGDVIATPRLWGGETANVQVGVREDVRFLVPRGRYDDLKAEAVINEPLVAPLALGAEVGRIELSLDGEAFAPITLSVLEAAPEGSFFSRMYDQLMLMFE